RFGRCQRWPRSRLPTLSLPAGSVTWTGSPCPGLKAQLHGSQQEVSATAQAEGDRPAGLSHFDRPIVALPPREAPGRAWPVGMDLEVWQGPQRLPLEAQAVTTRGERKALPDRDALGMAVRLEERAPFQRLRTPPGGPGWADRPAGNFKGGPIDQADRIATARPGMRKR